MRRNNNIGQDITEKEIDALEKQRNEQFKKDACGVIDAHLDMSEFEKTRRDIDMSTIISAKYEIAKIDLSFAISKVLPFGDLSDLGNTIGIAIAEYISDKPGFEKEDFIEGIKHGISLKDGTHGN